MERADWERACQAIASNSRAIAALGNQIEAERRFYLQRIESNSKAIAALANQVEEHRRIFLRHLEVNSRAISDITDLLREFQHAQKSMTQTMGDQQQVLKDFREIIALILERLERSQSKTKEYLHESQQELANLQEQFSTMQQELIDLVDDLKISRESIQG